MLALTPDLLEGAVEAGVTSRTACTVTMLILMSAGACGGGGGTTMPGAPTATVSPPPSPPPPVQTDPDPAPAGPDFLPVGKGWQLAWSDEFDGTELDRTKWAPEESCWGGGNQERQCYTDRTDNIQVVNGLLRLIAQEETFTGPEFPPEFNQSSTATQPYTSGKVRTRGLADWTYGRVSARMKLPAGQGTWPAFWMLPTENHYGNWPLSGEIDVMEAVNLGANCDDCSGAFEDRVYGTLHFGDPFPDNKQFGDRTILPNGALPQDGYHVYSVEWGEGQFDWYVDDVHYHSAISSDWYTSAATADGNPFAPFDRAFYLMFNLAAGGTWPENANENTFDPAAFPSELLVDWVRVYECAPDPGTGRACMSQ